MTMYEMKLKLKESLKPCRFEHSVRVMEEAVKLARHYGWNIAKAETAGLLHDCAKCIPEHQMKRQLQDTGIVLDRIQQNAPQILHGMLGYHVACEEYGVRDSEILNAIFWHTTGKAAMTPLEKNIFIADYIESGRNFPGVELAREAAYRDINLCIRICSESTIQYILSKGELLHPYTIETRNDAILSLSGRHLE